MMELVMTTGAAGRAKLQLNRHHRHTNTMSYYNLDISCNYFYLFFNDISHTLFVAVSRCVNCSGSVLVLICMLCRHKKIIYLQCCAMHRKMSISKKRFLVIIVFFFLQYSNIVVSFCHTLTINASQISFRAV